MHQTQHPYSNQPESHTQGYPMIYSSEPGVNFSSMQAFNSNDSSQQPWMHLLKTISPSVSKKLTITGICYILFGIISVGVDIGLLTHGVLGYFIGIINGVFLVFTGILILILCRQQVYVLTNLFILVFFQLILLLTLLVIYILFFVYERHGCDYPHESCFYGTIELLTIIGLIHTFISLGITIFNLTIITKARRPPTIPRVPTYVAYAPQAQAMPISFQNPGATAINQ